MTAQSAAAVHQLQQQYACTSTRLALSAVVPQLLPERHAERFGRVAVWNSDATAGSADEIDVTLTPLSFVAGCTIEATLGSLSLHLIKETWTLREEGGVSNFCHAFIAEAHAMARAHIRARGGNASLKYRLTQVP